MKIASNTEITTVEENKMEMKGLMYPLEAESSDEVVAMIIIEAQAEPLVVPGVASRDGKVPVEISALEPIMLTA